MLKELSSLQLAVAVDHGMVIARFKGAINTPSLSLTWSFIYMRYSITVACRDSQGDNDN